jgi:hypothetical protein
MAIDYNACVRKGIAAIEAHTPGATDRINLNTLDVACGELCPLAQSLGDYDYGDGLIALGLGMAPRDEIAAHGFILATSEIFVHVHDYAPLTEAWCQELAAYRTAKAALVAD